MLQKAKPLEIVPRGNAPKCLSYREAWTRIKVAQDHGFYFEAVTLQESIITDRLHSYFVKTNVLLKRTYLGDLIKKWKEFPAVTHKDIDNLQESVDLWRDKRNRIVHAFVKTKPDATIDIVEIFLEDAQAVAQEGSILARAVCKWHKNETGRAKLK